MPNTRKTYKDIANINSIMIICTECQAQEEDGRGQVTYHICDNCLVEID